MESVALLLMIGGWMIALMGYAGMIVCAIRRGVLWVLGLVFVPFFSLFQLVADFSNVWMWWGLNVFGGVVFAGGYAMLLAQAETGAEVARAPRGPEAIPMVPGVYVPQEAAAPGFLESVDPMMFALLGGISVFFIVGCVAGLLLIGTMRDPEPGEDAAA